jgi:hypothetical protein
MCLIVVSIPIAAQGQTAPSAATLPGPAPTTRPPYVATAPPAFVRAEIEGRTFFVKEADRAWVTQVVEAQQPTTRPTTMPTDLFDRVAANRDVIKQRMIADLALDTKAIDQFLTERLLPDLTALDVLDPRIIYLVTDSATLRDIVKGGWQDPHVYYNRAADKVALSYAIGMMGSDDNVLPVVYEPNATTEQKRSALSMFMTGTESYIMNQVADRGLATVMADVLQFLSRTVFEPLKAKPDQEWFTVGVAGVLGSRYVAPVLGVTPEELVNRIGFDDPRNPIRSTTIDLLHPNDLTQMRREAVPAYVTAFRAKATRAARALLDKAGDGAAAKIITAWKQTPPSDGAALIELIKKTTNVDPTPELRAH